MFGHPASDGPSQPSFVFASFLIIAVVALALGCSKGGDDVVGDDDDDNAPPATTTDLHVNSVTTTTVSLGWTAPGDNGTDGIAYEYDFRGALDSITSANFTQAYQIDSVIPLPAGYQQVLDLDSLTPGTSYYFAFKARDQAGNWSGLSNCVRADCPGDLVVTFPDAALDSVVREHINLPNGDIHLSDVDTVRELWAEDAGISDLTGMEYLTGLEGTNLFNNNISDLTPLQGLANLWGLALNMNPIIDISPLSGLSNLVQISVGQCPISDITPLAGLTNLMMVKLNDCNVTDFSPIYGLPLLESLDIHSNSLDSLDILTNFAHLKIVNLTNTNVSDLTPLAGLTTLERLYLSYNHISDLSSLSGLINLIELDLSLNQIVDIEPLVDNPGIDSGDVVVLLNNPLSTESIDTYIPALQARGVTVHYSVTAAGFYSGPLQMTWRDGGRQSTSSLR